MRQTLERPPISKGTGRSGAAERRLRWGLKHVQAATYVVVGAISKGLNVLVSAEAQAAVRKRQRHVQLRWCDTLNLGLLVDGDPPLAGQRVQNVGRGGPAIKGISKGGHNLGRTLAFSLQAGRVGIPINSQPVHMKELRE